MIGKLLGYWLLSIYFVESIASIKLDNSCIGKADGEHWLQLSNKNENYEPVKVECSNEYVIINVAKDAGLENYFSTWQKFHYALAGPTNYNPCTWQEWFIPERDDSNSKYLLSPDCQTCDENSEFQVYDDSTTYWMTGAVSKLFWGINGINECDFDTDTYQCYDCTTCNFQGGYGNNACLAPAIESTSTDYSNAGMCGIVPNKAGKEVTYTRRETQTLATSTTHYKPSIGTDGRFCVCYQPSDEFVDTYEITNTKQIEMIQDNGSGKSDSDNDMLKELYSNGMRVNGHTPFDDELSKAAAIENNQLKTESELDQRHSNIVYLSQSDFEEGTYRILESGTYILTENIEISFNENDDYWPRSEQSDKYVGAGEYQYAYCMGFFAGITVETNYVTIDLNNFELKMGYEYYYQQRWFALIELSNQQFLPGQGPAFFGPYAINVDHVSVKNGILGRSSHFGIHGNYASNILIENVHIRDFVTHGMQLNGWNGLIIKNVEIGPNSVSEYLRGEYGHGRLISRRLQDIEERQVTEGTEGETVTFYGRMPLTISDIGKELDLQMEMALDYALNRGKYNGRYAETDYVNPKYLETESGRLRWLKAKTLFIQESGLPSASSITGMFLNFDGANVNTYAKYTSSNHQSNNGYLHNVYIHDLTHDFVETVRLGGVSIAYTTPWLSDIPGEGLFGSKERLMDFYFALHSADLPDLSEFKYVGSALTDAYIAMWSLRDDWDIMAMSANVGKLYESDETHNLADWAFGNVNPNGIWRLDCNQDIMSHSGKGILGLRIDGSNNIEINNLKIENLYQHSKLGSYACGEYSYQSDDVEGGHFRQKLPIQTGFSGNNLQAITISATTNVKFSGNTIINNINTDYSEGYGISVWTANSITVDSNALIVIKNVETGKLLDNNSPIISYDSLPNRGAEACAFRLEISYETELFETDIIFEHNSDENNLGTQNVVVCNVKGTEYCLGDESNGVTLYGNDFGENSEICDKISTTNDIAQFVPKSLNSNNKEIIITHDNMVDNEENDGMMLLWVMLSLAAVIVIAYMCRFGVQCLNINENNKYDSINEKTIDHHSNDNTLLQYGAI